jgi:hypothetical protein
MGVLLFLFILVLLFVFFGFALHILWVCAIVAFVVLGIVYLAKRV